MAGWLSSLTKQAENLLNQARPLRVLCPTRIRTYGTMRSTSDSNYDYHAGQPSGTLVSDFDFPDDHSCLM
eukprot:9478399-Pyramimonas_sp.AAC.4